MSDTGTERHVRGEHGYVLVVDDDAAIRDVLTEVLQDEGYLVRSAANGREALAMLRQGPGVPAIILLDLMMPVMSGWEFRAAQCEDPALADIPVVVLSASRDLGAGATAVRAASYLPKPVDLDVLIDTVSRYGG